MRKPLLVDLLHPPGEAARGHAPDVPPVAAGGGEHREPCVVEHGVEHQHVVEVGAAGVGIVVQEDVALVDVFAEHAHDFRRRVRHREVVDGVVVDALGDEPPVAGDQGTGEVVPLVDDRRVRRMDYVRAHLVDDRDQGFANELEPADLVHQLHSCASARRRRRDAGLARKNHRFSAADADLTVFAALNAVRVLDVLSSTPARPDSRSPCENIPSLRSKRKPDHLHALASRIGEIFGLESPANPRRRRGRRRLAIVRASTAPAPPAHQGRPISVRTTA